MYALHIVCGVVFGLGFGFCTVKALATSEHKWIIPAIGLLGLCIINYATA